MPSQADKQLNRVRKICNQFPDTLEKLSHGEPTFFAGGKKVFTMFTNNHHDDGRIAVWLPAPEGAQEILTESDPKTYFRPPYVGPKRWIGIGLKHIDTPTLDDHITEAWLIVAPKKLLKRFLDTE